MRRQTQSPNDRVSCPATPAAPGDRPGRSSTPARSALSSGPRKRPFQTCIGEIRGDQRAVPDAKRFDIRYPDRCRRDHIHIDVYVEPESYTWSITRLDSDGIDPVPVGVIELVGR